MNIIGQVRIDQTMLTVCIIIHLQRKTANAKGKQTECAWFAEERKNALKEKRGQTNREREKLQWPDIFNERELVAMRDCVFFEEFLTAKMEKGLFKDIEENKINKTMTEKKKEQKVDEGKGTEYNKELQTI